MSETQTPPNEQNPTGEQASADAWIADGGRTPFDGQLPAAGQAPPEVVPDASVTTQNSPQTLQYRIDGAEDAPVLILGPSLGTTWHR
ncbi:hypothetical protein NBG84_38970 [Streptomyces sp. CWNU-1]|uniref:Alpha/beta hydrolase n=1 Tax=Streptomyces albipurpureus TaxID=2897419 RepID=A0ABT0V067_9ACTN|nr:hypothetical protein [Streptomyces sp. CWNU-1]MCM2394189.1 hypothetical protein [Streptomyces sp. CWNU-1]